MKKRELLAAGIIKDYRFINHEEYEKYLRELDYRKWSYQIIECVAREEGTVLLRVSIAYNQTPLNQLYED